MDESVSVRNHLPLTTQRATKWCSFLYEIGVDEWCHGGRVVAPSTEKTERSAASIVGSWKATRRDREKRWPLGKEGCTNLPKSPRASTRNWLDCIKDREATGRRDLKSARTVSIKFILQSRYWNHTTS